jgi:hypothetical protein
MPIATMIPSSNSLDDVTHARCYCDRVLLSVTQHSNGRGEVICLLLHVPWVNRSGHLPSHTLPFHSFVPAHCPPAPLLNPSHGSVWRIKSSPLRQTGPTHPIGKFFVLAFFSQNAEPSLSRIRLFGYIAVFAYNIRDDERTIWHHAR